jgi:hypothetical protein
MLYQEKSGNPAVKTFLFLVKTDGSVENPLFEFHARAGLPDGIFSNPKSKFGKIL